MINAKNQLQLNQQISLKGCFTEEYFLRGLSLEEIGNELGLPGHRLSEGAYIAWAIHLPKFHEFELGGWAQYATDNFVRYKNGKMKWDRDKFEETYQDKRMPISIERAKMSWLDGMRYEKLIKVLPMVGHNDDDVYPSGGKASQIIIKHPVKCQIVKFLRSNDRFSGVWG